MVKAGPTRDEKLKNLIVNHSMIFMGVFEEALSDVADKMTEVLAAGGAAMVDALGGASATGKAPVAKTARDAMTPEIRSQIAYVFSGIREEIESQWPKDAALFKRYVSGPAFDKGIEIVERYDFARPRLTEELDDQTLASYVFLVKSGDPEVARMLKELAEWQSSLPRPPWAA